MSDMLINPLIIVAGIPLLLVIGGLITLIIMFMKVPEARFFGALRIMAKQKIWVRIHYYNNYEGWTQGHIGPDGKLFILDEQNKPIAINPKMIHQNKNTYRAGLDIIDVSSNSIWPIGVTECLHVHEIDEFVENQANECPRLKGMDQMVRHTIIGSPAGQLRDRIKSLISIDDNGLLSFTLEERENESIIKEKISKYNEMVETELKAVVDEYEKVRKALNGKVIMDRVFSWTEPCMTINSQLQAETVDAMEWYVKNMLKRGDEELNKLIKWAIVAAIIIFSIGGVVYMLTKGG